MNHHQKFSLLATLTIFLFATVFAFTGTVQAQNTNSSGIITYTVARNGSFTNLVDSKGNLVYTIIQNGSFKNVVDPKGNVMFTITQNGSFMNLVDLKGNAVFTITQNGPFLNLTPIAPKKPRRSEINKSNRRRAEVAAKEIGLQRQQHLDKTATLSQKLRDSILKNRSDFQNIGFTDEELDRYVRVLVKFEESNNYLSKHPEPIRHLTGIAESNANFGRRHGSWSYDARPHLKMLKLCREEIAKFKEKYNRLGGK